jgi:alanyl-tRNA synthetase
VLAATDESSALNQPFLYKICDKVVEIMGIVYPELLEGSVRRLAK